MLPKYRHFVPQSSFIGMMLAHDNDYELIQSNQILGPLQHDLNSWQFSGKKLVRAEELTDMGKMNDGVLRVLVGGLDDESEKVLDTVLDKVLSGVN